MATLNRQPQDEVNNKQRYQNNRRIDLKQPLLQEDQPNPQEYEGGDTADENNSAPTSFGALKRTTTLNRSSKPQPVSINHTKSLSDIKQYNSAATPPAHRNINTSTASISQKSSSFNSNKYASQEQLKERIQQQLDACNTQAFKDVGAFYEPVEIEIDLDEVNRKSNKTTLVNQEEFNDQQVAIIDQQIIEQLNDADQIAIDENEYLPNFYASTNMIDINQQISQNLIDQVKKETEKLPVMILKNSSLLKTLGQQVEEGSLDFDDDAPQKIYDLETVGEDDQWKSKFENKPHYLYEHNFYEYNHRLYIVMQQILCGSDLKTCQLILKVMEYDYETKNVNEIHKQTFFKNPKFGNNVIICPQNQAIINSNHYIYYNLFCQQKSNFVLKLMKFDLVSQKEQVFHELKLNLEGKLIPFYSTFFKEHDKLIKECKQRNSTQMFIHTSKYNSYMPQTQPYEDYEQSFILNQWILIFLFDPSRNTFHYQIRKLSNFDKAWIQDDFINISRTKIKTIKLTQASNLLIFDSTSQREFYQISENINGEQEIQKKTPEQIQNDDIIIKEKIISVKKKMDSYSKNTLYINTIETNEIKQTVYCNETFPLLENNAKLILQQILKDLQQCEFDFKPTIDIKFVQDHINNRFLLIIKSQNNHRIEQLPYSYQFLIIESELHNDQHPLRIQFNGEYLNKESCNFSKRFSNISLNQTSSKNKLVIDKKEYLMNGSNIPTHLNPRFLTIKQNDETVPLQNQTIYNDKTKVFTTSDSQSGECQKFILQKNQSYFNRSDPQGQPYVIMPFSLSEDINESGIEFQRIRCRIKEFDMDDVPIAIVCQETQSVYLLLLNLTNCQILQTIKLDIDLKQLDDHLQEEANIVYTSELYLQQNHHSNQVYLCQNYTLGLKLVEMRRISMFDFIIKWTKSTPDQQNFDARMEITGRKEFICKLFKFERPYPMLGTLIDDNNIIKGLSLNLKNLDDQLLTIEIPNNPDHETKLICNDLSVTKYKQLKLDYKYVALLVESRLREDVQNNDFFSYYDKCWILKNQLKTCLNMYKFSMYDLIYSSINYCNFFQSVEGLYGMSILDLLITRPQEIREILEKSKHDEIKSVQNLHGENVCFLRELFLEKEYNDRIKHFLKCELLRAKHELYLDFNYTNIIERCIWKEETSMVSADIILDFLFKQDYLTQNQLLFQMLLQLFLNHQQKSSYFFKYLGNDDRQDMIVANTNLMLNVKCNNAENLPKFSHDELFIQSFTLDRNDPLNNIDEFIENKIKLVPIVSSDHEVEHYYIDWRPMNLHEKVRSYQDNKSAINQHKEVKINDFKIADIMVQIVEKVGVEIEQYSVVKDIIDFQFEESCVFFYKLWIVYNITFLLPFILQLFLSQHFPLLVCQTLCFCSQMFFFGLEIIQMKDKGSEYFNEIWNIFDCSSLITYIIYTIYRRLYHYSDDDKLLLIIRDYDAMPDTAVPDDHIALRCLCMIILFQSFMKSMFFLRVNDNFGHLVQLIGTCLYDVRQFMLFFGGWILFFGLQYLIIGLEISTFEYPGIGFITRSFIQAWRNSIGDMAPPHYDALLAVSEDDDDRDIISQNIPLVVIIWALCFSNQFMAVITLLNFLIAIISSSYEQVMSKVVEYKYQQRADFNREYKLHSFQDHSEQSYLDCMIFTVSKRRSLSDRDWSGFVTSVTNFVKEQNIVIKDRLSEIKDGFKSFQVISLENEQEAKANLKKQNDKISMIEKKIDERLADLDTNMKEQLKQINHKIGQVLSRMQEN